MAKERKGWKPFVQWQHQEVELTFDVKRVQHLTTLVDWLTNQPINQSTN